MRPLLEQLRGARRIEWFVALVLLALLILALTGSRLAGSSEDGSLEQRLERILSSIDGVGEVRVMIAEDGEGRLTGAVIVAKSMKDIRPTLEIQKAVRTLLDIDESRIRVIGALGSY